MFGPLLRQLLIIIIPTATAYAALLAISFALYPQSAGNMLDPNLARDTFLKSPPAYLVYGSSAIVHGDKTVILLGASNVSLGFRPDILSAKFSDTTFHNMSLGGTSIDGIGAMTDLVFALLGTHQGAAPVFIAGLWYGEFLFSEVLRDRTPVAQQMNRFGLFERSNDGYRPTVPLSIFKVTVEALRPYFLVRSMLNKNGPIFGREDPTLFKTRDLQELTCTASLRRSFREIRAGAFEKHGTTQFEAMVNLASEIRAKGGKFILVDLPHPRCMTEVDTEWQLYQSIKLPFIEQARNAGALYWNLQDIDDDKLFIDATHPNSAGADAMENRLAHLLRENSDLFLGNTSNRD